MFKEYMIGSQGCCPVCGSDNLTYEKVQDCDTGICYPWICDDCGETGKECFSIDFDSHQEVMVNHHKSDILKKVFYFVEISYFDSKYKKHILCIAGKGGKRIFNEAVVNLGKYGFLTCNSTYNAIRKLQQEDRNMGFPFNCYSVVERKVVC